MVITAAASGVGAAAVQIAKWKKATVVATSEKSKSERLLSLGADIIIDKNANDQLEQMQKVFIDKGATFILELVGKSTLQRSIDMLDNYGRIVCVGTLSGDIAEVNIMDLIMKRGTIKGSFATLTNQDFKQILTLFANKTFKPVIDCVLPLKEARAAHERIEAGGVFGKIILQP